MDATGTTGARAGGRRFRVTVLAFAAVNLAAWLGYHHFFGSHRQRVLRVDGFAPGDRATIDGRAALEWQFNLDVAPESAGAGGAPAEIRPAVVGDWEWRGRRNLVFRPRQELPKATRFAITIPAGRLRTPEGFAMAGAFEATVATPPLRVLGVRQAGAEDGGRFVLEIEFDDVVIPAEAAARLALTGPDGKPLAFRPHGEGAGRVVRVLTDPVVAPAGLPPTVPVTVALRIDRGLAGAAGPLGLERPFEQPVSLGTVLAATEVTAASPQGNGRPELQVRFNGPVDAARVREVLSVEPAVPFTVASNYGGIVLDGDFRPGSRYAVKIAAAPAGADARAYPRADVFSAFVPDRSPSAWFEHEAGYLGSQGNRTLLARAVNLPAVRVRLWRVYDGNLVEWRNAANGGRYRWQADPRGYAKPVAARTIALKGERNVVQDVRVALDDLLPPGTAAVDGVFRVSLSAATAADAAAAEEREERPAGADGGYELSSSVVTLSDVGLTAKREPRGLTVWATSLATARPLDRVRVRAYSSKNQLLGEALTAADGVATLADLLPAEGETVALILADRADRPATRPATTRASAPPAEATAFRGLTWMDLRRGGWDPSDADVAGRPYARTGHDAYVYTERGVYRPGETVRLRAIVRRNDGQAVRPMPVRWSIRRPDLREWKQEVGTMDGDGGVALDLTLPEDLTTGRWTAQLGLPGEATAASTFGSVTFLVEEYMPNRLKVGLEFAGTAATTDPAFKRRRAHVSDEPLRAVVQGDYLFGRPAAGLQAKLAARLDPAVFQPPDWAGWTFGDGANLLDPAAVNGAGAMELAAHELDDRGRGEWQLRLDGHLKLPSVSAASSRPATTQPRARFLGPWLLSVEATVQETGGRSVSAADTIAVDALPRYVGLRRGSAGPVAPGAPAKFEVALVGPSGKPAANDGDLEVSLLRESWNNTLVHRDGRYRYDSHRLLEPVEGTRTTVRTTGGRGAFAVTTPTGGSYVLRVHDAATGATTSASFYASNGSGWDDNVSREHPERLEVVILQDGPSGEATTQPVARDGAKFPPLRVGQAARVLVRSPFAGRLLLTVETDRVVETRVVDMPASSVELSIAITEALRPNAYVSASVIRPIDPQAKWRTHRAHGTARLVVDPADRRLAVEIQAPAEARPASTLDVRLRVTDPAGLPVAGAPVTLAAVDEGILQLTRFRTPDPLGFFHAARALGVESGDVYGQLMPEVPRPDKASLIGGDRGAADPSRYRSPVTARRVRPVALLAEVRTDADGVATGHLQIPEFAGRLRLMAVAHAGPQFGSAERPVPVRAPLLVQSSFPRFAGPGDRFTVPVTLFNNERADLEVTLVAELLGDDQGGADAVSFAASSDRRLTLAPTTIRRGGQHVLALPMVAGKQVGVARVRLTATAGSERAAETTELPVRAPSPLVSRGGYAVVAPGPGETLALPDDLLPGVGRTRVTLSPMPSLQLPQGIDYLERYPYGCAEQTVSTSFALIHLGEIGPLVAPGVFEKRRVAEKVQAGILRLLGAQTADGGLSMWPGGRESWPWASVYAAHFIVEARAAGHAVPEDFHDRLLAYARNLLTRGGDGGELLECQAYAAYVLALAGKPDRPFMNRLGELTTPRNADVSVQGDHTAMLAQARLHLSLAWLAAGRGDLAGEMLPATLPGVRGGWQQGGNVGSPVRDRAMHLNTLLTVRPDDPAIPALAGQLAGAKWQTTQDAAFAAMAIGKYLKAAKGREPYEKAELLLDGKSVAAAGAGPLAWESAEGAAAARRIAATVTGPPAARGYLSWIRTGVSQAVPPNEDRGVKVRRRYLDERGRPLATNAVQSGDLVLVELTVEAAAAHRNLVVEDLLPAGLEIENERLDSTAALRHPSRDRQPGDATDPELRDARLDVRDDRMILFGHLPDGGRARHVYAARAVVAGTFALPPTRAECMYDPGVSSLWGPGGALEVRAVEGGTVVGVPAGE
jgi:hypothetical protein